MQEVLIVDLSQDLCRCTGLCTFGGVQKQGNQCRQDHNCWLHHLQNQMRTTQGNIPSRGVALAENYKDSTFSTQLQGSYTRPNPRARLLLGKQ